MFPVTGGSFAPVVVTHLYYLPWVEEGQLPIKDTRWNTGHSMNTSNVRSTLYLYMFFNLLSGPITYHLRFVSHVYSRCPQIFSLCTVTLGPTYEILSSLWNLRLTILKLFTPTTPSSSYKVLDPSMFVFSVRRFSDKSSGVLSTSPTLTPNGATVAWTGDSTVV